VIPHWLCGTIDAGMINALNAENGDCGVGLAEESVLEKCRQTDGQSKAKWPVICKDRGEIRVSECFVIRSWIRAMG
jgi:hypothetical protein